MELRQSIIF